MVKDRLFRSSSLVSILVIVPVSILLYYLHANIILTFLVIAAALAAITRLLAESTRIIAERVSNTIAALANVTFGNAVEFFVAIFALRQGLVQMVKASIIGSIIINVLLLVGLSMFIGGMKYQEQKFNKDSSGLYSTMLMVVVVGLGLPSLYVILVGKSESMSLPVSIVLGTIYILSLLYTLVTHKHLFVVERDLPHEDHKRWSTFAAVGVLIGATLLLGFESQLLVNAVEPFIMTTGLTQTFIGLVVIALLTNVPELMTAITFAHQDNMTLSLEIGMSSALQIALFVVPVLVFISPVVTGNALNLVFTPFELIAVVITAMLANYIGSDGVCHWVEGAELVAVYMLIAIAFYFL
jgi:Ca2+:H+ antiporter